NKDNVKNCFRIEGGDDVITDMVRAVNMNGSNYIYQFADFQYNDMSEELKKKIKDYQDEMSSKEVQDEYYGENGIYTRLCNAYDELAYYESSMMPNTDMVTDPGKAKKQYDKIVNELTADGSFVAVSSLNNYDDNLFVGVTNNVEAYAQVFLDSRFDLEIVRDTTSYSYDKDKKIGTWKGKIRITQHTDETNVYPVDVDNAPVLEIKVNEDVLEFAKQKVYKALSKASLADIDFDVAEMDETGIRAYFNQYSLNRLQSFSDAYNSCISILATLGQTTTSEVQNELYNTYERRYEIVESVKDERQKQVDEIKQKISDIQKEQKRFQEDHDFVTHLGEHYKEFCAYRREDVYKNDNYISDGRTTSECLAKAKELIEATEKEAKKACVLQRIVSTSLNNLFALPEFEPLYDKFALYNYIRIRTEDEILKLRLIGIDFSGDSVEKIDVTFSEQIESIDGTLSDLQSIIHQAKSMATSYPSTALQAKQGADANSEIADIYDNGLNAEKTMFANNDNNEVTITQSGIICKRMDNEGFYDGKQLRITGNVMAFTDDDWKSVKMAIGERIFKDSNTLEEEVGYGIIADNIIGKLIASDKCIIGNEDNNVIITGDGIDIMNGSLCIANDDYSIEIDPNHRLGRLKNLQDETLNNMLDEIRKDFLFCIRDKNIKIDENTPIEKKNDNIIMGIDTGGNGYFKGNVDATSITAKEQYNVNSNGQEIPLISGSYTALLNRGWTVHINFHGRGIFLQNSNRININGSVEQLLKTDIYTDIFNDVGVKTINKFAPIPIVP
ncbi:hypothetical protein, partial [Bacteroides caecimuris]|uniref:hypothetical protein n=1 Tax=Bacteroides caecimuris TaxID=1796613 RepID=UPI00321F81EF